MKKLKAGLFSVANGGAFDAKVASANFKAAAASFRALARRNKFDAVVSDKILYNRGELDAFLKRCAAEDIGMLTLHTASFAAGEMGQQTAMFALDRKLPYIIWGVPEATGGPLTVNNLCCTNFMTSIAFSLGVKYKWLWGTPGDVDVESGIAATAAAARAISAVRNTAIIIVGSARVPGFYGSNFDETAIKKRYGVHVEHAPLSEFYKIYDSVSPAQANAAVKKIRALRAVCAGDDAAVERSARAYLALKKIALERGAAGLAVRCWPEMRDDIEVDACLPMGMLGDDGIPCSCEADVPGLLTMLFQYELTGRAAGPPALLDMVSFDKKSGSVGLWHCGVCSPSLGEGSAMKICRHNIVEQGNPAAKMGLVLELSMKPGPATICRFQGDAADRYIAAEGNVLKRPPAFRGSYGEFKPETMSAADLLNTVMTRGITHHYSIAYTAHLNLIDDAAYWLGVAPVETAPAGGRGAAFGKV